jgi:hypothetical protein
VVLCSGLAGLIHEELFALAHQTLSIPLPIVVGLLGVGLDGSLAPQQVRRLVRLKQMRFHPQQLVVSAFWRPSESRGEDAPSHRASP